MAGAVNRVRSLAVAIQDCLSRELPGWACDFDGRDTAVVSSPNGHVLGLWRNKGDSFAFSSVAGDAALRCVASQVDAILLPKAMAAERVHHPSAQLR